MVTVGKYTDKDQNILEYSVFMPEGHSKALLHIVISGSETDAYYENLCKVFNSSGIAVFFSALDIASNQKKSDAELVNKILYKASAVRKRYKNLPFFVMGQAISSLAVSAAAASNNIYDGMILVSPDTLGAPGRMRFSKLRKIADKDPTELSEKAKKILLSRAGSVRKDALSDTEEAGLSLNSSAVLSVAELLSYVFSTQWYKDIPKGMSTLLATGEFSPFSDYSEGVKKVCDKLDEYDMSDVIVITYSAASENVIRDKNVRFAENTAKWISERAENIANAKRMGF